MRVRRASIALIVFGWLGPLRRASAQPTRASESPAAEKVNPARSSRRLISSAARLPRPDECRPDRPSRGVLCRSPGIASRPSPLTRILRPLQGAGRAVRSTRIGDAMVTALDDRNDRLRAAAYGWFEHHPDPKMVPRLLAALTKESRSSSGRR